MARNDEKGSSFVLGFVFGGIIGAAIGLILAPKSGTETRHIIQHRSEEWRNRAEEMAANLSSQVSPAMETARDRVATAGQAVRERVEPAIETARERINRAEEQVSSRMRRSGDGDSGENENLDEHTTNNRPA